MQKPLFLRRAILGVLLMFGMLGYSHSLQAEFIRGLQPVAESLPWFDSEKRYEAYDSEIVGNRKNMTVAVTSVERRPLEAPLHVLLSRTVYPAEDGYLDVLVQLDSPEGESVAGSLQVSMLDAQGQDVGNETIHSIPGDQLFFSCAFPESLAGSKGTLQVIWDRNGNQSQQTVPFEVLPGEKQHLKSGKIRIDLNNPLSATVRGLPQTLGIPFPRGVLRDTRHLRLVDDQGKEIPIQVRETARWSRYGSVRWVLLDFVANLEGEGRYYNLEYGDQVTREEQVSISVNTRAQGFPEVDVGWIRIGDEGVSLKTGGGEKLVLPLQAMLGAFVEKVEGVQPVDWGHRFLASESSEYTLPEGVTFEIEQSGSEKVVLKIEGDYLQAGTGASFCRYVIRYVIFRDSPLVRVFHTWVFTGDGNRDRIRNMGWHIPFSENLKPLGFLSGFDQESKWLEGYYLRQEDHDRFTLFAYEEPKRSSRVAEWMTPNRPIREIGTGVRAPGVMAAEGDGVRLYFGVKDFWQNFPNSLMQTDEGMTFYQWPRYGAPRRHSFNADTIGEIWRLWFAHEGEVLSFGLPIELTEGPLHVAESGPEPHIDYGRPESVNAQGVAKTAEMWFYFTEDSVPVEEAVTVLEGLNSEQLRAVVDPEWLANSEAFYEIHAKDEEKYQDAEESYQQLVLQIPAMVERMGIYGKWIYGDLLRPANLDEPSGGLYRTFRKSHWGWPYSWIPFARSGDSRLYKFAEAATRMMTDVAFCHYVSDDVREQFENMPERRLWIPKQPFREIGWHNRNLVPWGGYWGPTTRMYVDKADYLWHAWLLTGYDRAREVALTWAEQTKIEMPDKMGRGPITAGWNRARWPVNLQKQYLEMYQMTFDPWFLAAAHAIADLHQHRHKEEGWKGHPWATGPREFQRYTGDAEHLKFYLDYAHWIGDWQYTGWANIPSIAIPDTVFAWYLTKDDLFLRRAAGILDLAQWAIADMEEPPWYKGWYMIGQTDPHLLFASWYQQYFPLLLELFERAGGIPKEFIPLAYSQRFGKGDRLFVEKASVQALPLRLQGGGKILDVQGNVVVEADSIVEIPEGTPPGVYTIEPATSSVLLPVTPPGTREVLSLAEGKWVQSAQLFGQHWFYVPQGVRSFNIEFTNTRPDRLTVRQVKIWSPSGDEAWVFQQRGMDHDPKEKIVATVEVPEGASGLWRITQGGPSSMPFTLDPQLPGIVSHSPDRWIDTRLLPRASGGL